MEKEGIKQIRIGASRIGGGPIPDTLPIEVEELIKELEAANDLLKEHIKAAIADLPECPDSAKEYLIHALTGGVG